MKTVTLCLAAAIGAASFPIAASAERFLTPPVVAVNCIASAGVANVTVTTVANQPVTFHFKRTTAPLISSAPTKTTDASGEASFTNLAPGSYQLFVSVPAKTSQTAIFNVPSCTDGVRRDSLTPLKGKN